MQWDEELTEEQRTAASHLGSPARVLAGPGTGNTRVLTRRIQFLIQEKEVPPEGILALTFTRAAAHELRQRLQSAMPGEPQPRVSTLHSFALRQLLRNAPTLITLPQPLRIADDWEERRIILEDIKAGDLYPAEELYRLTALQRAWKDKDQAKSDQYGQQINVILDKYQGQAGYKTRILPLLNAFGSQK